MRIDELFGMAIGLVTWNCFGSHIYDKMQKPINAVADKHST